MPSVFSEVGRLRRVLVHEPGPEVDRMVPAMMEQLLFDDILYGERARDEHARFRRVLQLFGIEVLESADLLKTALENPEARKWVIEGVLQDLPRRIRDKLAEQTPQRLGDFLIGGLRRDDNVPGVEVDELYSVTPIPNYCFQRDPQIVLGSGVLFSAMAAPARHREALLSRLIFNYHPEFSETQVIFDPFSDASAQHLSLQRPFLEGGDLLVLSKEIIAVGMSERTNRVAIRHLARSLARREDGPRYLVVVDVPRRRAYMHLDTLFTAIDVDRCLAYPPVILKGGVEQAKVYTVDLHGDDLQFSAGESVLETLATLGLDLEPVPCGGDDYVTQQREQWTDGANSLALSPGVITLFDRNTRTAEELSRRGFRIVESEDVLLGKEEVDIDSGQNICILLKSNEISRARGGPHCLTHPLERDPLP